MEHGHKPGTTQRLIRYVWIARLFATKGLSSEASIKNPGAARVMTQDDSGPVPSCPDFLFLKPPKCDLQALKPNTRNREPPEALKPSTSNRERLGLSFHTPEVQIAGLPNVSGEGLPIHAAPQQRGVIVIWEVVCDQIGFRSLGLRQQKHRARLCHLEPLKVRSSRPLWRTTKA